MLSYHFQQSVDAVIQNRIHTFVSTLVIVCVVSLLAYRGYEFLNGMYSDIKKLIHNYFHLNDRVEELEDFKYVLENNVFADICDDSDDDSSSSSSSSSTSSNFEKKSVDNPEHDFVRTEQVEEEF